MLQTVILFFVLALIAAFFGFGSLAATFSGIAQILFFLFLVLFIVSLIMYILKGRPPRL